MYIHITRVTCLKVTDLFLFIIDHHKVTELFLVLIIIEHHKVTESSNKKNSEFIFIAILYQTEEELFQQITHGH